MNIDPNNINTFLDFLPQSTKEQLFNPAASAIGRGIGGILEWTFQKPIEYGIVRKQQLEDLANKVANKIEKIPQDNRDDSKMGLTIKAFDNSKYSLDSDELRTLFANLVAGSVDNRINSDISPLFPSILGDMSTADAVFLKHFSKHTAFPAASLDQVEKHGHIVAIPGIIDWNYPKESCQIDRIDGQQKSIDFFASYGIIKEGMDGFQELTSKNAQAWYNSIEQTEEFISYNQILEKQDKKLVVTRGHVRLTELGTSFVKTIIATDSK